MAGGSFHTGRALSPGINDPGTAIDIVGRHESRADVLIAAGIAAAAAIICGNPVPGRLS